MSFSSSLHTAARRYCIEQHAKWSRAYSELRQKGLDRNGQSYTDKALSIFPRYNTLAAILIGVEKIDPENLPDSTNLKNLLIKIGHSSESVFTNGSNGEIESRVMIEERNQFCEFIRSFDPTSLISPLPYRRVLMPQEIKMLWNKIFSRWKADGTYWYPLADRSDASLFAFHTDTFDLNVTPDQLREVLRRRGISRVYELREHGDENYQLDAESWEPYYNGAEGFWVSDVLDWILYASHEGSMTTGGWLTDEVFKLWPDGRNQPWSFMKYN